MKKILILMLSVFALIGYGQNQVYYLTGKTIGPIDVAGLSGTDTTIVFTLQGGNISGKSYSIQSVLTDTVETGAIGVYLQASNDGTTYTTLADSVSLAVTTYPQGLYFTGTSFPFVYGRLLINKNAATDGDVKFIILFR